VRLVHIVRSWLIDGLRNAIEAAIARDILPLPTKGDEAAWVDRYLVVLSTLSDRARNALTRLNHLADRRPTPHELFVRACEAYNVSIAAWG
jgi:hypothetical protein